MENLHQEYAAIMREGRRQCGKYQRPQWSGFDIVIMALMALTAAGLLALAVRGVCLGIVAVHGFIN